MACPDENELGEYVAHPSDDPRCQHIEKHLETCAGCRDRVLSLARSLSSSTEALLGAVAAADPLLARGTSVGRYVVLDHLGRGGMGVVYAAYDPELDRKVALKLIRTREPSSPAADASQSRLLREAQAMARVAHPNVVHVYDVGVWNERVFIAMEFVDGQTLGQWLRAERRDWRAALALLAAAGRGLAAAHAAGLVHRDFKPDNVLIGKDGRARVTDFGLARPSGPPLAHDPELGASPASPLYQQLTHTGALLGTPAYMAPEQMHGEAHDARTDIFSFCVALYEALYGERPFAAPTMAELAAQIASGAVGKAPPSATVPARLRQTLLRGLRADPAARHPSMEALLAELTGEPASRRRLVRAGVALALVGVLAAGWAIVRRSERQVCQGGARKLAGLWDDVRQAEVRAAFAATGASFAASSFARARADLDRFVAAWLAMHVEACEATRVRGEQSEELLDLRMLCLDERRRALAAVTELFSHADAQVVASALQETGALGGVQQCADVVALRAPIRPPADAGQRRRVDELRGRLAAARALKDAGKYDAGLAQVTQLVPEAQALHYAPLEAEALLLEGQLQLKKSQLETEPTLRRAQLAAEASRDDRVLAETLIVRVSSSSHITDKRDLAHEQAEHAAVYLARLGGDARLEAQLSNGLTDVWLNEGNFVEGKREAERSVALARSAYGDESPIVASSLAQLAWVQGALQDHAGAGETIGRALAMSEKVLGVDHPATGQVLVTRAVELINVGKQDEALVDLRRAIDIFERALGPDNPQIAFALSRIADVVAARGRPGDFETALAAQQRAVAITRKHNPKGSELGFALALLSGVYSNGNKPAEALAAVDEAAAILVPLLGKKNPYVAWLVIGGRGLALEDLHRHREAIEQLEEALTLNTAESAVARLRFALAQALWGAKVTPARACELARQAQVVYHKRDSGMAADSIAKLDRWVAQHPAPR